MRRVFLTALIGILFPGVVGCVEAEDKPLDVIKRAIEAHGGKAKLTSRPAEQVKTKGTIFAEGIAAPFTAETSVQLPGRFKNVMEAEALGQKILVVQVLDGDKGWQSMAGLARPLVGKDLDALKEGRHADLVATLVPLLDGKGYQLSALDRIKIDGKEAVGVRVQSEGHKDVKLYFDAGSGLLVKTDRQVLDARKLEVRQEAYYSDFKDTDGGKRPMKFRLDHDGKKVSEGEITDIRYADKLDDKVFQKP